jgi:hypothetical protein
VITGIDTGRATITAQAGAYSDTCDVTVDSLLLRISLIKGKTVQWSAALTAGTGGASWSSSNIAVASVDADGNVKGIAEGNAVITVTAGGMTQQAGVVVVADTDSGGRSSRTAQPTLQPAEPQAQCTPQIIYVPSGKASGENGEPPASAEPGASESPETPPAATPGGSQPDIVEPEAEQPEQENSSSAQANVDATPTQGTGYFAGTLPWIGGLVLLAGAGYIVYRFKRKG